jgi:S-methylmethionine-dependent homocysteine/selenocysteine methylase
MAKYRNNLPQLAGNLFLTDGGIETYLVFQQGIDLPEFAAFDLLKDAAGRAIVKDYFRNYIDIAKRAGTGFVLESVTWRANPDWATKIGYSAVELDDMNRRSIEVLRELRDEYEDCATPMVVSGCIGPRHDGYNPEEIMSATVAQNYHTAQIESFQSAGADMVTAITMTNTPEAIGITKAAQKAGMPSAISFTVETDGTLPTRQKLSDAITQVDAKTDIGPVYYMINCAHPSHFEDALAKGETWVHRIRGIRANASKMSHAELDNSEVLDEGNPVELGGQYRDLRGKLAHINVLGGCCGTDHRHIEAICHACAA